MTFDGERKEGAMTTLGKTLKRLRILRKELAGIGFELTIGKSEYLDEAALVDTPGDVFPYRFVSVLARRAHVMGGRELRQAEGTL